METIINELLAPCILGVFAIFAVWLQRKVLKEDKNVRKTREIQLNDIYAPLWKLQKEMEFNSNNELQQKYEEKLLEIYERYYSYLDEELVELILKIRNTQENQEYGKIKEIISDNYSLLKTYFEYHVPVMDDERKVYILLGLEITYIVIAYIAMGVGEFFGKPKWINILILVMGALVLYNMFYSIYICFKREK